MNYSLQPLAILLNDSKSIKTLSFSKMGFTRLPVDLSLFPNLEHLDLSDNGLRVLPKEISKLKKLKSINLSGNPRLNLSKSLFALLDCEKLIKIDLSHNRIDEVPAEMFHFENLEELILDGNPLDVLSERNAMNLPEGLSYLSMADCTVDQVSKRIKNLKSLKTILTTCCDFEKLAMIHWQNPLTEVTLR